MPGSWVLNRFFWLFVLGAWSAAARGAEPVDVATCMPADTAIYVGWTPWVEKDAPEYRRQCELIDRALKSAAPEADAAQTDLVRQLVAMLAVLPTASGGLGVFDIMADDEALDVQAAFVLAGADCGKLNETMDSLAPRLGLSDNVQPGQQAVDQLARLNDVALRGGALPGTPLTLWWGVHRECFLFAVGRTAAAKVIDCLDGRAETLATTAEYKFDRQKLDADKAEAALSVYINVRRVVERARALAGELGHPLPPEADRLLDELGIASVRSKMLQISRRGGAMELRAFAHVDGPMRGLLKVWDQQPLKDADLAIIPEDAYWAYVTNLDLAALWGEALRVVEEVAPDALPPVQGALAASTGLLGFSLVDDLLPALGDTWALFDAPGHGGLLLTGSVLVAEVNDKDKLEAILDRCLQMLTPLLAQNDVKVVVKQTQHGPHTVHYVLLGGVPSPVAPAWGFVDGRCVFGLFPQTVAAAMRAVDPQTRGATILDQSAVKAARAAWPKDIQSFRYCDTRYVVRLLYPVLNGLRTLGVSMLAKAGAEIDLAAMPPVDEAVAGLTGSVGVTARDADGILMLGTGSGVLDSGVGAATVAAALIPAVSSARANTKAALSQARLAEIGAVCMAYADEHDGRFPASLQTLVEEGLLTKEELQSLEGPQTEDAFVFVAGQTRAADDRNVLAYELYGHQGVHAVLFLDGHVERMSRKQLASAVRATYERLGRAEEVPPDFRR